MAERDEITMTSEEIAALNSAARSLSAVLAQSPGVLALKPRFGSPIEIAYKANLHEIYHLAYALTVASEDYLRAILLTLKTGPLPMYALYTLLRAAAEADVRCRHLLEPGVSQRDRLARALNERLDNLEEQRKALAPARQDHFADRVVHLQRRALTNGIAPVYNRPKSGKRGDVIGFGEPRRSEVDLFGKYLRRGSLIFRFLSGYAHSKPWIWLRADRAQKTEEDGVSTALIDLDVVLFANLLGGVVGFHEQNLKHWEQLAGHRPAASIR